MNFDDQRYPRCCGCIGPSPGVPLVLLSWTGISLYFASLSFMGKSPFYSYLNQVALIIFGVINVLFAAVCLYGFRIHFRRHTELDQYRRYSKLLSCFTTVVVVDIFCNFIVYCVQRQTFQNWCIDNSKRQINQQFISNTSLANETTIFNCSNLLTAEIKFSIGVIIVIAFIYAFWASFISRVSRHFYIAPPSMMVNPNMMMQQGIPQTIAGNVDAQHSNMAGTIPTENTQAPNMTFANIPPSRDQRIISVEC